MNAARTLSRQRGMTLIEIMVVVAIISLILGGVGVMAFNRFNDARLDTAKNEVVTIQGAIEQYRVSKRKCPKCKKMKAPELVVCLLEVISGLYFIHEHDVAHLDIVSNKHAFAEAIQWISKLFRSLGFSPDET